MFYNVQRKGVCGLRQKTGLKEQAVKRSAGRKKSQKLCVHTANALADKQMLKTYFDIPFFLKPSFTSYSSLSSLQNNGTK